MALSSCLLVCVGGRRSHRLGPLPTLGSLRPSHQQRHKSRVSLRGPPCAHGILGTPHGEVRDKISPNPWFSWSLFNVSNQTGALSLNFFTVALILFASLYFEGKKILHYRNERHNFFRFIIFPSKIRFHWILFKLFKMSTSSCTNLLGENVALNSTSLEIGGVTA